MGGAFKRLATLRSAESVELEVDPILDLGPDAARHLSQELVVAGAGYRPLVLLRTVWGFDFDGDPGIIDVYVGRLRRKLGRQRIENRRGLGYRLVAE